MSGYYGDMEDTEYVGYICFTESPRHNRGVYAEYTGTGIELGVSDLCGGEIMKTLELTVTPEQAERLAGALIRMAELTRSSVIPERTYRRTLEQGIQTDEEARLHSEEVQRMVDEQLAAAGLKWSVPKK